MSCPYTDNTGNPRRDITCDVPTRDDTGMTVGPSHVMALHTTIRKLTYGHDMLCPNG